MPSLLTNLSLGIGGLTVAGGVTYGAYALTRDNTQSIEDLLKKNQKTLLTSVSGDADAWKTNWEKYIETNSTVQSGSTKTANATDFWGLTDWGTKKTLKDAAPETFKNKCGEKAKLKVVNEEDQKYKEVLTYCTKEGKS